MSEGRGACNILLRLRLCHDSVKGNFHEAVSRYNSTEEWCPLSQLAVAGKVILVRFCSPKCGLSLRPRMWVREYSELTESIQEKIQPLTLKFNWKKMKM